MSSTHAHTTGDNIAEQAIDKRDDDIAELIYENGSI
ncbi:unnamed protein product, partial [Adineta steineri]